MRTDTKGNEVELILLELNDYEDFIADNQRAFKYGAMEEFGLRDDHIDADGEIISRSTIEKSIEGGLAFRIVYRGEKVGGVIITVGEEIGDLDILFIKPEYHSKGIAYQAWLQIEAAFPHLKKWRVYTPHFEKRNIHFYINKCGFHAVEFFNDWHKGKDDAIGESSENEEYDLNEMFLFEKIMKD